MANSGRQHKSATRCAINKVRARAARPDFRAPGKRKWTTAAVEAQGTVVIERVLGKGERSSLRTHGVSASPNRAIAGPASHSRKFLTQVLTEVLSEVLGEVPDASFTVARAADTQEIGK
jgi:hypothetical protein